MERTINIFIIKSKLIENNQQAPGETNEPGQAPGKTNENEIPAES
jgi:hypothetical protein